MQPNPHIPGTPDEFIEQNLGLARTVAWGFFKKARNNENIRFDKDDFMSIAYLGLIKAYQKFDPTRFAGINGEQVKFSTFAVPVIRGEIMKQTRDFGNIIRNRGKVVSVDSLDLPLTEGENKTLGDVVQIGSYDIEESVIVSDFLSQVGPRLQRVHKLRALGLRQREIGKIMGISQVQIGRMELYMLESARMYGLGCEIETRTGYRRVG